MHLAYTTGAEASARTTAPDTVESGAAWLPLADAAGRTLAADLRAVVDVPHYDSSAMDGYAVAGDPPWHLDGPAPTGSPTPLLPGRARTIVTGGPMPDGASGVVRVEYTTRDDQRSVVHLAAGAPASELEPGRHVRLAGREAVAGDLIATAGRPLTPPLLAMAAICGHDDVQVRPAVTAALLLTGDEVRTSGIPGPGEVRDAFEVQLPHVLRAAGVQVVRVRRIGDDPQTTAEALAELADTADVVMTTGGTARSAADHVRAQLETSGRMVISELAMRPGHPTMLSVLERPERHIPVLALPGNPLAAMAAMRVVGSALLRGLRGDDPEVPLTVPVAQSLPAEKVDRLTPAAPAHVADEPVADDAHDRTGADAVQGGGTAAGHGAAPDSPEARWLPRPHVGSSMMRGLTAAQGWLVLPTRPVAGGERISFLPLDW
nr:molybdopterin molybdotransferase MoeA [Brevibacterium yomogidense]